jgi:hypothetical protein
MTARAKNAPLGDTVGDTGGIDGWGYKQKAPKSNGIK